MIWTLKEGVWIDPGLALLEPEMMFHLKRMLDTAARTAPEVVGGSIVCTAISREDDPERFSYHAVGRAVDIRTGLSGTSVDDLDWYEWPGSILNQRGISISPLSAYRNATQWAAELRLALGDGYDVVYGFDRNHVNHIHIERDKRDGP